MAKRRILAIVMCMATVVGSGIAAADTSNDPPLTDPIPAPITMSGLEVRLEHVATIPATGAGPITRINGVTNAGDGSDRLFLPDMRGDIFVVNGSTPTVYLDVEAQFPDFTDAQGLGSGLSWLTFDPDFATNGRLYTVHTEDGAALATAPDFAHQLGQTIQSVVTEWTASTAAANTFAGTSRELMRVGFDSNFHNVQQLEFGPDGYLYISIGDGDRTIFSTGPQSLDRVQGKLLRIDPSGSNSANGSYGIPATNPFVGMVGALGEIYALGFRNPHRFSWDQPSGKLLLGNIGQGNIESVYQVLPGAHHGWNEREGAFLWDPANPSNVYPLPPGDAAFGYTYPVAQYDHDEGFAVVGGFVHRHPSVPELFGQYLFGDISRGRIFHATEADLTIGGPMAPIGEVRLFDENDDEITLLDLSPANRVDLRFGMDEDGTVLVTSKQTGDVFRITSRNPQPLPTVAPGLVEVTETPGGVVASIPFTLSAATPLPVSVDVTTLAVPSEPGWADATDFIATSGAVVFAPNTVSATFDVVINDDVLDEADELVVALTSNPVNAEVGGFVGLGFARILDNDAAPTVSAGSFVANPEGDSGSTIFDLPITLSAPSGQTVTVDWSTLDVPSNPSVAHPGSDVVAAAGTVTFAPGETTRTVPIEVIGDTVDEPPLLYGEWGFVELSNPTNTSISGGFFGLGLYIVVDDD